MKQRQTQEKNQTNSKIRNTKTIILYINKINKPAHDKRKSIHKRNQLIKVRQFTIEIGSYSQLTTLKILRNEHRKSNPNEELKHRDK